MIDSAKVLTVDPSFAHTRFAVPGALLTQVNTTADLDVLKFAERDKELSWRDLAVASSLLQVALETATVWSFPVERPRISIAVAGTLAFVNDQVDRMESAEGAVVHVLNSSIPSAAILTDQFLYNRDSVLNEVIVRASRVIKGINLTALFPQLTPSVGWSKGEGVSTQDGIGLSKMLNVELFKNPDRNLAYQDNQLAGYVARLVHALMNPFEVANRLLVEVTGTNSRPAEVYTLVESNDAQRVWSAEPALSNRMRIVYNRNFKTLRWVDESPLVTHIPQPIPIALTTSGTAAGTIQYAGISVDQQMVVRTESPTSPSLSNLKLKSGKVNFPGILELDGTVFSPPVSLYLTSQPIAEYSDVVITSVGQTARFSFPTTLNAGTYRVSVLVAPDKDFDLLGSRNISGRTGVSPGCDCPTNSSTDWKLSLPVGYWLLQIEYTTATPVIVTLGGDVVNPSQAVNLPAGTLALSLFVGLNSVPNGTLRLTVPLGGPTVYVRRFLISSQATVPICDYNLTSIIEGGHSKYAVSEFTGKSKRTDVISFDFTIDTNVINPVLSCTLSGQTTPIPIRFKSFHIQSTEIQVATPDASGLDYWKYEMVNRASRTVAHKYLALVSGVLPKEYAPPPADLFAARSTIDLINRGVLVGSSALFTKEDGEPAHVGNSGGKSGWWKWVAKSTGTVTLQSTGPDGDGVTNSGTSFDALLAVYTGSAVDLLIEVASSGNGFLQFVASAGVEYQIAIDGYNGAYGAVAVTFETAHPSNELFDNALAITGFVRNVRFTSVTVGWINWTAPLSGKVKVDASVSSFTAAVNVYTGLTEGSLTPVASGSQTAEFTAVAGMSYKIKITGAGNAVVHVGPSFLVGGYWTLDSTNYWLTVVESAVSDLRLTFRLANPGDVGKPALVPRGLEVDSNGRVIQNYPYDDLYSEIVALQPWMLDIGIFVARREFWPAEAELTTDELAQAWPDTFYIATAAIGQGEVWGAGYYTEGSNAYITAIPDPTPIVGVKPVDIVFLVDESGSMSTEHTWLQSTPSALETALIAAGIGISTPNRYALVGFGSNKTGHGTGQRAHKHSVGTGAVPGSPDWCSAAEFETGAAAVLEVGGSTEDGYDAIDMAFRPYVGPNDASGFQWREGAVKVVVLITDEQRTTVNSSVNKDGTINLLINNNVVFAEALNLVIKSNTNVVALGRFGSNVFIEGISPPPYYTTSPFGSIAAGSGIDNGSVVAHYVDVAENVGVAGSEWDLNKLRAGGATAVAFTQAWVEVIKDRIIVASHWRFSHWVIDGISYYTSSTMRITVTRDLTVTAVFV